MIRRNRVPKRSCNAFVATRNLLIYLPTLQTYEKKATVAELHYCPHSTGSQSGKSGLVEIEILLIPTKPTKIQTLKAAKVPS